MDNPKTCPSYYHDASPETALHDTQLCISHIRSIDPGFETVRPILTPRFAPSCSRTLLTSLGALAHETHLPIQTHISENSGEMALVAELFPEHTSYTDVYDAYALLTPRTILAHAIHVSDEEMDVLGERKVGIAHCPASNTALTSGCEIGRAHV